MAAGAIPTNDGLTCVFVGTTPARFRAELAPRPQSGFASLLAEGAPELVDRMSGTRAAVRSCGASRADPATSASRGARVGRWWATPATGRTR